VPLNPAATETSKPELPQLRIFELTGLSVTIGFSGSLTPSAQAIVNRTLIPTR